MHKLLSHHKLQNRTARKERGITWSCQYGRMFWQYFLTFGDPQELVPFDPGESHASRESIHAEEKP